MAKPTHPDTFRICLFQLGRERFALPLEAIGEIVPMAALSRPPSMSLVLEGFLNLGGTAIPVLRIAELLGLPPQPPELHTPIMIIRGATPLGLLVNRVAGIVSVPTGGLVPIAATDSFNGCVDGRLTVAGEPVHLLSLERLLLKKEQQALAEFHATETRRLRHLEPVAS